MPDDDGGEDESELVDQPRRQQRLGEQGAAVDLELATGPLLELRNLGRNVA